MKTEERLRRVTLGSRETHNDTIYLAEFDPGWALDFAKLKREISGALGEKVLLLEHVGSTSIQGLAAKPIIDLLLMVEDSRIEQDYVPPLENIGYVLRIRETDWHEHRLLKTPQPFGNLHVFSRGCEEVERMILFRDWLEANPEDRILYEKEKRRLAAKKWKYTQEYADAKSEIVTKIMERAPQNQT